MKKYILAFDSGAKGTRFIDEDNSTNGTGFRENAKQFDAEPEAKEFNDAKGYACWIEEIENEMQPFKVVFLHSTTDFQKEIFASTEEESIELAKDPLNYPMEFPDFLYGFTVQVYFEEELIAEYSGSMDGIIKQ